MVEVDVVCVGVVIVLMSESTTKAGEELNDTLTGTTRAGVELVSNCKSVATRLKEFATSSGARRVISNVYTPSRRLLTTTVVTPTPNGMRRDALTRSKGNAKIFEPVPAAVDVKVAVTPRETAVAKEAVSCNAVVE